MNQEQEIATVDRAEAFWLPETAAAGRLVLLIQGTKPTPCHRIDISPLPTSGPSFAAVWRRESEFAIERETAYSYSEGFNIPRPVGAIALVCKGASGKVEDLPLTPSQLESDSLQNLRTNVGAGPLGSASVPFLPVANNVGLGGLAGLPSRAPVYSPHGSPTLFRPSAEGTRAGSRTIRDSGAFDASLSFGVAGYGECSIGVTRKVEEGGGGWGFHGKGAGPLGGGGYSGYIHTPSLSALISGTTSCAIVAIAFYGTVAFFDANANVLGNFHGGGWATGGGGYVGKWASA